ncbi:MAG: hypothetical protein JO171_08575, partial [Paludibacterium sp.]|nr:hypothetical protein [Paludibacterium sp.]
TKSFDAGPNAGLSTHRFRWTANRIAFQALSGLVDDDAGQYASWTFAPSQPLTHIPQSSSPLHMNLWLYQGLVPSDGKEAEVVISEFKYVPEARAAF